MEVRGMLGAVNCAGPKRQAASSKVEAGVCSVKYTVKYIGVQLWKR